MRPMRSEMTGYAVLLIILFCIAALAVYHTIDFVESCMATPYVNIVAALLWVLSLGFMFIAGAFGLLGIHIAGEIEGRRRVARIVDTMDYIHDGVVVLDKTGCIVGANAEAHAEAPRVFANRAPLTAAFPSLTPDDVVQLLDKGTPRELELPIEKNGQSRLLRFRSLPSGSLSLILISDITAMDQQRMRRRHAARLQLIGQLARGVANDFNELLCAIAGNTAVLGRLRPDSPDALRTREAIEHDAERGVRLAAQLLELGDAGNSVLLTEATADSVRAACDVLRDTLPHDWRVNVQTAQDLPTVGLSRTQLEQVVVHLALLVADSMGRPGMIGISLMAPAAPGESPGTARGGTLLIEGDADEGIVPLRKPRADADNAGIILSVIRSMLEETGGTLDSMVNHKGLPRYRVGLPLGVGLEPSQSDRLAEELTTYVAHWRILLAKPERLHPDLDARLREIGAVPERVTEIMPVLGRIDSAEPLDAIVVDASLLGAEPKALVRAMLKLRPATAVVILGETREGALTDLSNDIHLTQPGASADRIIMAMIEARQQAVRRKGQTRQA